MNIYQFCLKFFEEKLDVQNYLKTLDKIGHFKSIFLNYFQKLSLDHLKKKNLYNKEDREEIEQEYNVLNRKEYNDQDVDELMTLLLYFIDFLKKPKDSKKSFIDKKIINNLNPYLKSLINEYK